MMDKTKHTPGPWVAYGLESRSPYVCADDGKKWDNPEICNLFNDVTPVDSVSGQWLEPLPNAAANARLIAAAPDMLDLLYHALPCVEESEEFDKPTRPKLSAQIRALIKKIEGE